jgi:MYXO-CTERM domain-containing protein
MFPPVNWQTAVSLLIVALAAAGLLWGLRRRRKFRLHGHSPCGCALPTRDRTASSIVFRARKGERPQIIVKNK